MAILRVISGHLESFNHHKVIENDAENAAVQSTELIALFELIFTLLKVLNEDEVSFKCLVSSFQSIVSEVISVYHCAMKDNRTILRRKINKSRQGSKTSTFSLKFTDSTSPLKAKYNKKFE